MKIYKEIDEMYEVSKLYKVGYCVDEIADKLGLTITQVLNILSWEFHTTIGNNLNASTNKKEVARCQQVW